MSYGFLIDPTSDPKIINELLMVVNELLPTSMEIIIEYNESIDVYCISLYVDDKYSGQLGTCVSKRQLWRIYERLLSIYMVLERLKEKVMV